MFFDLICSFVFSTSLWNDQGVTDFKTCLYLIQFSNAVDTEWKGQGSLLDFWLGTRMMPFSEVENRRSRFGAEEESKFWVWWIWGIQRIYGNVHYTSESIGLYKLNEVSENLAKGMMYAPYSVVVIFLGKQPTVDFILVVIYWNVKFNIVILDSLIL